MRYIVALDAGTTSIRAVLYDTKTHEITKKVQLSFKQYFPKSGWVEHDANEIWKVTKKVLNDCLKGINEGDIFGLGISTQRETVVAWDKLTGTPAEKAIVWQCRRTADFCNKLRNDPFSKTIKEKTGLLLDAYFSASKIKWLIDNSKNVKKLLKENNLCVGTVESFLIYKLTNGKKFVTDITNASRTMLLNINTGDWDDELLNFFNVPREILPTVISNSEIVAKTETLNTNVLISGVAGDQQASLFGQGCFAKGMTKNTYGTGCFILINTGKSPKFCEGGLLTTIGYKVGASTTYAIEGSVFNAGSAIDWLCKTLKVCPSVKKINEYATKISSTNGVFIVPAFTGLGAPYWDMDSRGTIVGLTRDTNKYHLSRAVLESLAYSTNDVLTLMQEKSGLKIKEMHVDGGATNNPFLLEFQSSLCKTTVSRYNPESTCLGVIYFAGLATGAFASIKDIEELIKPIQVVEPSKNFKINKEGWEKAIRQCLTK